MIGRHAQVIIVDDTEPLVVEPLVPRVEDPTKTIEEIKALLDAAKDDPLYGGAVVHDPVGVAGPTKFESAWEALLGNLHVPERVLRGASDDCLSVLFHRIEKERLRRARESFTERITKPFLAKALDLKFDLKDILDRADKQWRERGPFKEWYKPGGPFNPITQSSTDDPQPIIVEERNVERHADENVPEGGHGGHLDGDRDEDCQLAYR